MLARSCYDEMIIYGSQSLPYEACGIVACRSDRLIDTFIPIKNIHSEPLTNFEFEPHAWIEALYALEHLQAKLVGYVHTHPNEDAIPSIHDIQGFDHESGLLLAIISYKQKDSPQLNWFQQLNSNPLVSYPLMLTQISVQIT